MLKMKKHIIALLFAIICCIALIPIFVIRRNTHADKIPKAILQVIKMGIVGYKIDYNNYPSELKSMYNYIKPINISGSTIVLSFKKISEDANGAIFLVEPYKNIRLKYYPQQQNDEKSTIVELNAGGNLFLLSSLDIKEQLSLCNPAKKY